MQVTTESIQFKDLVNGDPLLLRTRVPLKKTKRIKKGDMVHVTCESGKLNARIISDPITIISRPEEGYNEISVEVIKASEHK